MHLLSIIIAIFAIVFKDVLAGAPKLSWVTASAGGCKCTSLSPSSTVLTVPAQYTPPGGEVRLFIKRYMTSGSTATTHLIMLPGGPGQSETILEGHVQNIANFLGGSVALYLVDMRGVAQSQPIVPQGDFSWRNNLDAVAKSAPFPIGTITLSNAAQDVLQLAKAIKASPEFAADSKLSVFGVSFGAVWAYRALQLDSSLFHAAILDGILAFEGLFDPENDESLFENCARHPYCKEQFGGDPKNARKMFAEILNPALNGCTAILDQVLGKMKNQQMSREYRLYELLLPLLEGSKSLGNRYHSTQLMLAFIKTTHHCATPSAYGAIISEVAGMGGHTAAGVIARAADARTMNMLVNNLLFCSEPYNLTAGPTSPSCGKPTLMHHCMTRFVFNAQYQSLLKPYVVPRDPIWNKKPSGVKLYFVHGKVDLVTPYRAAARLAQSVGGRMLAYDNLGHSLISAGQCARPIYREALLGESSGATNSCLATVNSAPLDWTFRMMPKYTAWFDSAIDANKHYIPDPPNPSGGGGGSILWIVSIMAILLIAGGAAAVFMWKRKATPKVAE
ncbi:hypothetical protein PSACC_01806 [Paramicrosporidium saccamoebae]|uniref:Peptidase S33 tripeptidyl aminopeptidase-like C-terminal domain-containing protein n=1 Tax=Paramicrosporidium saccamoebae TaxID=1246581 RepID=A0A2H9TKX3_9FUNG|nr:hypothetical protein PSACC_01806 [Paramicrosporidium saccamoebae]